MFFALSRCRRGGEEEGVRWDPVRDPVEEGGARGSPRSRSQEKLSIQCSERTVHTVPRTFTCPMRPHSSVPPCTHVGHLACDPDARPRRPPLHRYCQNPIHPSEPLQKCFSQAPVVSQPGAAFQLPLSLPTPLSGNPPVSAQCRAAWALGCPQRRGPWAWHTAARWHCAEGMSERQ